MHVHGPTVLSLPIAVQNMRHAWCVSISRELVFGAASGSLANIIISDFGKVVVKHSIKLKNADLVHLFVPSMSTMVHSLWVIFASKGTFILFPQQGINGEFKIIFH